MEMAAYLQCEYSPLMTTSRRQLEDWEVAECAALKAELAHFNATAPKGERLTQEEIAHALGMSQGTLNSHLNGKRALNKEIASKFAILLGITVEKFSPRLAAEITEMAKAIPLSEALKVTNLSGFESAKTAPTDAQPESPDSSSRAYDPTAGSGSFLTYALDAMKSEANHFETGSLPADVERVRTILQNIHALSEYKGGNSELQWLANQLEMPVQRLQAIVNLESSVSELVELAEDIEIKLKLPEGAMTVAEPGSLERKAFLRYLLAEQPGLDPYVEYEARLKAALATINQACNEGRTTIETVHKLEEMVKGLPTVKRRVYPSTDFPRTQKTKDKKPKDKLIFL